MEKGDLFFKVVESRYDSWRTVQKYLVYHYSDKTKPLAIVTNLKKSRQEDKWEVVTTTDLAISCTVYSMDEVLNYIVEQYEELQ